MKRHLAAAISIFSLTSLSLAEEMPVDLDDFLNMSLEELTEVKVTVASKRLEPVEQAPSVVSVIHREDIDRYGGRHLRDVLDRMVNTQVLGSHHRPHGKLSVRAVNNGQTNNEVLILINERPLRDGIHGSLPSDIFSVFPLSIIERIEVIRGPGSVLYGTNAMAGVINIVTRSQSTTSKIIPNHQVSAGTGSFDWQKYELTNFYSTEDFDFSLALTKQDSKGDRFSNIEGENGSTGTYKTGEEAFSLVSSGSYKSFNYNIVFTEGYLENANSFFTFPSDENDNKRVFLDFGYEAPLTDDVSLSLHTTYNRPEVSWIIRKDVPVPPENTAFPREQLYEATLRGSLSEQTHFILGGVYTKIYGKNSRGLPYSEANRKSVYGQMDYQLGGGHKIIGGFQWNNPEESKPNISPRLGYVYSQKQGWGFKALYSEAFRSPFIGELFLSAPALAGNPNLEPEEIYTTDLQINYRQKDLVAAVSLYYSRLENRITRVSQPSTSQLIHANSGKVDYKGVEFELDYEVSRNLNLVANSSWQSNEINGLDDSTFAPQIMVKLGMDYDWGNGVSMGLFNSFIDDSSDLTETNATITEVNPKPDAYNLLSLNLRLDLNKKMKLQGSERHSLTLYLDNIFDEKIYSPNLNPRGQTNSIPHHWGVGAYLTYGVSF